MKDPPEKFNLFFQGFSILIAIIVTYYQLYQIDKEQTTQAMFLFGIIIGIFLIGLILSFTYSKYKEMRGELKENRIKMEDIQKELRYEKRINELDKRIGLLEAFKKDKKGQTIDPRWVILVILIILFYMYLKSIKVI